MPAELEIQIVNYVTSMWNLGFGLTVNQVRRVAFKVIEAAGIKHPINLEKIMAGWYWWASFKQRYNLTLRTPENLSLNRAAMASRMQLDDFYDKVELLLSTLDIADKPSRLWNCNDTGLSYVLRSGKIIFEVRKKCVYHQGFGEKGQTTTLLCCISVSGMSIPPRWFLRVLGWMIG